MTFANSAVIGQRFAFAYGRMGVLQQSLLSQSDIDRLLGSHDRREAEQILTELKFTKLIDQSLNDTDSILHACAQWIERESYAMSPKEQRPVFDILWMENDAAILSYLLKRHHGLTSEISREPPAPITAYAADDLRGLVAEGLSSSLPPRLVSFVSTIKALVNPEPRMIDALTDRFFAEEKLRIASAGKSGAIKIFVRHQIDIQNIRTALRLAGAEPMEVRPYLIEGGFIKTDELTKGMTHAATAVRMSGISYRLADLIERRPDDVNTIEQALVDILAEDISTMWNLPLRIEPVFAFVATALAQLRLLRVILIGKRNELSPQTIKSALPPFLTSSHYSA